MDKLGITVFDVAVIAVAIFGDPLQYARALTRFEELRLDPTHALVDPACQ